MDTQPERVCADCETSQPETNFYRNKKGHMRRSCKGCVREASLNNYRTNRERRKLSAQAYRRLNPDRIKEIRTKYYIKNKSDIIQKNSANRRASPQQAAQTMKKWTQKNKDRLNSLERDRYHRYRKFDPKFKLKKTFSRGIRRSLRSPKDAALIKAVGYGIDDLRIHLERQFTGRMSWGNYGTLWHIDHIVPLRCFTFDDINDEEFKRAWALSNLRPLWKKKNLQKGGRRDHLI